MSIEIKTASVEPVRLTFDHIEARIGKGKTPTRYQEAVHDMQMTTNFHYRPTWDPEFDLFDKRRTAIQLDDFDVLVDPRQYYYAPYTIQRAKQQEAQENNFTLIEKRKLLDLMPAEWRAKIERLIIPLRHAEWGANNNNCHIADVAYGAPFNSAALMEAMDHLGVAQYLTRLALALDGAQILDRAKTAWMNDPDWQPLRRLIEDLMVTKDWFELHVAQNLLLNSALFSYAYVHFEMAMAPQYGMGYTMATEFMREWFAESTRWTDSTIKVTASASANNQQLINGWVYQWEPRMREALAPLVLAAFGSDAARVTSAIFDDLKTRRTKLTLAG